MSETESNNNWSQIYGEWVESLRGVPLSTKTATEAYNKVFATWFTKDKGSLCLQETQRRILAEKVNQYAHRREKARLRQITRRAVKRFYKKERRQVKRTGEADRRSGQVKRLSTPPPRGA
jgi:hypothetical protein